VVLAAGAGPSCSLWLVTVTLLTLLTLVTLVTLVTLLTLVTLVTLVRLWRSGRWQHGGERGCHASCQQPVWRTPPPMEANGISSKKNPFQQSINTGKPQSHHQLPPAQLYVTPPQPSRIQCASVPCKSR
jgi:hypothetical protein